MTACYCLYNKSASKIVHVPIYKHVVYVHYDSILHMGKCDKMQLRDASCYGNE